MTTKLTEPTSEYLSKVQDAVKDLEAFKEEEVSKLLAFSCWRHGEPFPKEYFEEDTVQFSDDDKATLDAYIVKLDAFTASLEDNNSDFADTPLGHYHGSFTHSHEGGDSSHTHAEHAGAFSKTKPSSDSSEEQDMPFTEQVTEALGLPKDATSTQVIEAIGAIKASTFTEEQQESFKDMQHNYQVNQYMEATSKLTAIPGTPIEIAEKLTILREKTSPEIADERLADLQTMQKLTEEAGVTSTLLQSKFSESGEEPTEGPAETILKKYVEDKEVTFPVALALHAAGSEDMKKVFHAYYAEQNLPSN